MNNDESPFNLVKYSVGATLILVSTIVALFWIIGFVSKRFSFAPLDPAKIPYQLALYVANVWFIEFLVFIVAIAIDAKFKCFGFSNESAMGGLYFIIFGPIVFGITWLLATYTKYTPSDAQRLFVIGSRIGVVSSAFPFLLLSSFALLYGVYGVVVGQEKV